MNQLESQSVIAEIPREILAQHRISRDDLEVVLGGPETYVKWFILLTPLLWLTGALLPAAIILLLGLFWRIPARKYLNDWVVLSWWLVFAVQAAAVLFNWMGSPESMESLFHQVFSFPNLSWLFMGAALAVGKYSNFDCKQLARFASIISLYIIVLGIVAFIIYKLQGDAVKFITPLGYLLPEKIDLQRFFFTVEFYSFEHLFNMREVPRLVLFYPWPLVLSFAGIGLLFITINENRKFWKYIGITGALVAIFGSMGRMGIIAAALCLLVYFWGKLRMPTKWIMLTICSIVLVFTLIFHLLSGPIDSGVRKIEASREDSTEARMLAYELTWEAIHKSPVIGYGFHKVLVSDKVPVPLGSHSTILGLLYTGGAITFASFCLAVIITLWSFRRTLAIESNKQRLSAFCIFLALLLFTATEGINYFFISNLIIIFWMGMALAPFGDDDQSPPRVLLL
jgi:hypothetical protein